MTFKEDRKRKRIEKREEHIETAKQIQELFPSKRLSAKTMQGMEKCYKTLNFCKETNQKDCNCGILTTGTVLKHRAGVSAGMEMRGPKWKPPLGS